MPEVRHAMASGHCSLQLGVWGALSPPPAVPRKSPDGGPRDKTPERSRLNLPKIHLRGPFTLNYNFMNFVDSQSHKELY